MEDDQIDSDDESKESSVSVNKKKVLIANDD